MPLLLRTRVPSLVRELRSQQTDSHVLRARMILENEDGGKEKKLFHQAKIKQYSQCLN